MFEHAARLNWEGIVSKNADAPYRSERTESWVKVKTIQKGRFPVVGFIKDPSGVAALYLGKKEGNDLVYVGKVGTGWSRTVSSQIRKRLDVWSVRVRSSPNLFASPRPRGLNQPSPPTLNIPTSHPKAC